MQNYDLTLAPGDWVVNSEGGLLQIKEISHNGDTFSAVENNKGMYYTTNTNPLSMYHTRRALFNEIPNLNYEIY